MSKGKVTSFDIAYRAGVSQSTVSRAMSGSPLVSQDTRDHILAIAREMNYTVDKSASNLRRQHSATLAVLIFEDPTIDDSLINPFFTTLLGAILKSAGQANYDVLVSFQQFNTDWHAAYLDSNKADGLLLLGYGDYVASQGVLERLAESGTKFVRWGNLQGSGVSIGSDNRQGGYAATHHLLQRGARRIAFIGDCSEHSPEFRERYLGYCDALAEFGIEPDPALQVGVADSMEVMGERATKQLLESGAAFDGLFAASDLLAIGSIYALHSAGRSVPGDVAVVGFDDMPVARYHNPPLTTVHQDTKRAGQVMVEAILAMIKGEAVESQQIASELVVRSSA